MSLPADSDWTLSASQLETFASCQRKWAWEKIAGFRDGGSAATALGGRVHKVLEDYLEHDILPDQATEEGRIATAGLHLIPAPRTHGMIVEFEFRFQSPRGNMFTGRKDYILRAGEVPVVGDHKTTSAWTWTKSAEELRGNIQAIMYAADELLRSPGEAVDLEWVYYLTRGTPNAKKVSLRMLTPEVEQGFTTLDNLADQIHQVRATIDADHILDLPPTLDTCNKFNKPCPHSHRCNFTPHGRLLAVMASQGKDLPMNGTNDLMARLAAQAAADPNAPPPPAPGPTPLDVLRQRQLQGTPPFQQPVQQVYQPPPVQQVYQPPPALMAPPTYQAAPLPPGSVPGQVVQMVQAPPALVPPGTPLAPPPPPTTWYLDNGINFYSCQCGLQVSDGALAQHGGTCPRCNTPAVNFPSFLLQVSPNPPEQHLPPPANAATSPGIAPPPPQVAPTQVPGYAVQQLGAPPHIGSVPMQEPAPAVAAGEKPKRHRRTKAEMEAARASEAAGTPPPVATFEQRATTLGANDAGPVAASPTPQDAKPIARLLIDALPIGAACQSAEQEVFAPARALVKQACQVDDYRQLDFGKGPGVFASAVQNILDNGTWETMYVDSRSADAMHVISILTANADEVIRGMT